MPPTLGEVPPQGAERVLHPYFANSPNNLSHTQKASQTNFFVCEAFSLPYLIYFIHRALIIIVTKNITAAQVTMVAPAAMSLS